MHPGVSDFREKKKCERVYLPGGGPAGPPHRPESLAVFKILAAPPCATIVRGPHRIPTMVRRGPPCRFRPWSEWTGGSPGPPSTPCVSDQWSGFPAFREGPPRPKFVKNTRFSFEIASEIIHPPCVLQSSVNAYSCTAAADLRVTSVVPQPQHIASFNQATYSST